MKKSLHELAKEFPNKTYRELEKYRNIDRQEEAARIPLSESQKSQEELEPIKQGVCVVGVLKKDVRSSWKEPKKDTEANLILDIDRFHKRFDFKKNNNIGIPDDDELVNFRTSFLMEELAEYTNAIVKKDTAKALDALVDIVYIALGTAWLFNLPFDKAWKEIQAANMKKVRAKDKTGKRGTKFDVIKPKEFKEPNIERIIEEEREWNDEKNSRNRL
jgi:predicted HAD superfamily Cof-like phosphohydrolase